MYDSRREWTSGGEEVDVFVDDMMTMTMTRPQRFYEVANRESRVECES